MLYNRIFKQRNVEIGIARTRHSFTGVMLRGSGIPWDENHNLTKFIRFRLKIQSENGDCYDRYLCRIEEMRESVKIILQCIELPKVQ